MSSSEVQRIALLQAIFDRDVPAHVRTGIGDDAAVLDVNGRLVVSVDEAVEEVHFRRAWLSLEDVGYRATMAALSDLAAMAARPLGVLASLVLPTELDDAELEALARGQAAACADCGTSVIGGNLSRGERLSIGTTVLGETDAPLLRSGARSGDRLWLAGDVGLAAAGLAALSEGRAGMEREKAAWRRPRARIAEGLRAAAHASAAIDLSDGLAIDAQRMSQASEVALLFEPDALIASGASLEQALHGGEDYALLIASPVAIEGFRDIGVCQAGRGVWLQRPAGREAVEARGWDHFDAG